MHMKKVKRVVNVFFEDVPTQINLKKCASRPFLSENRVEVKLSVDKDSSMSF